MVKGRAGQRWTRSPAGPSQGSPFLLYPMESVQRNPKGACLLCTPSLPITSRPAPRPAPIVPHEAALNSVTDMSRLFCRCLSPWRPCLSSFISKCRHRPITPPTPPPPPLQSVWLWEMVFFQKTHHLRLDGHFISFCPQAPAGPQARFLLSSLCTWPAVDTNCTSPGISSPALRGWLPCHWPRMLAAHQTMPVRACRRGSAILPRAL